MGDVLTGIITALLAQGYTAEQACVAGSFLHGKAGDELMKPDKLSTVLPGKLAAQLPVTLAKLQR
jgi:NAD(P)H-hydrate repair Nnr-like enzyme with NAD(P)H-hydrate dehydratase domain